MKVAVGSSSFASDNDNAMKLLLEHGIEVIKNPYGRKMTEGEIIGHLQGAQGLLAGLEPLTERVFAQSPQLKAIARVGIGMDNVDMVAAERRAIKISNTPDGPTAAVAEMCLAALLSITHCILPANKDVHDGIWKKRMGRAISDLNILMIGYGHIGQKTAELFRQMGATIQVYDKYNMEVCTCSLEEGLRSADVLSLHASGKDEILSERELSLVPCGAIILNSARGGLINEDALYAALKEGAVSWFWGDALWEEPYSGKLCSLENAILTPHICTYTTSCRVSMETEAVKNLLEDLGYV